MSNCIITCAAKLLGKLPEDLIELIGHDGTDIWWPYIREPLNLRSFHIMEIQKVYMDLGYALAPIEAKPMISPDGTSYLAKPVPFDFYNVAKNHKGILLGDYNSSVGHACIWEYGVIKDIILPDQNVDDFNIHELWAMI